MRMDESGDADEEGATKNLKIRTGAGRRIEVMI